MRALIQRVKRAQVTVDGRPVGSIGRGLAILLGVHRSDTTEDAERLAGRCWTLRLFPDAEKNMELPVADVGGEILVVSQFTLYADTSRGRRPSFADAAPAEQARSLYEAFCKALERLGAHVETGVFGAMMDVELVNEGPVTVLLESSSHPKTETGPHSGNTR